MRSCSTPLPYTLSNTPSPQLFLHSPISPSAAQWQGGFTVSTTPTELVSIILHILHQGMPKSPFGTICHSSHIYLFIYLFNVAICGKYTFGKYNIFLIPDKAMMFVMVKAFLILQKYFVLCSFQGVYLSTNMLRTVGRQGASIQHGVTRIRSLN